MFESVRIPKKLANSPINEAVFEIRYDGNFPGEALYGVLFDVFKQFPNNDQAVLPIMQFPKQILDQDPNLRYQPFYRVSDGKFTFSIGPHSIVFSSLKPYAGWVAWSAFFGSIITIIQEKNIIKTVEQIGLRYINLFDSNIIENINAGLILDGNQINTKHWFLCTTFTEGKIVITLNAGNVVAITSNQSVIDVDGMYTFKCNAGVFFSSYQNILEETHKVDERVFFGLLKEDLINTFNPEY